MNNIKVGVLGVGHLGRFHAQNYKSIAGAELIGVYDVDKNRCDQIAEEFQVQPYENLEELLEKIDAASIVVTTSNHFEITSKCLEHNVHCLVEKPITSTLEEADKLIRLAKDHDRILQVGHIERFNPALVALGSNPLNPMFIESHRLASFNPRGTDVAVVLDLMIHDLDIILHLVKSPVKTIDASGVAVITDEVDIANARISFENGCVANVTVSRISLNPMRKMRIFQPERYITIDFQKGSTEFYRLVGQDDNITGDRVIPMEGSHRKIVYSNQQLPAMDAMYAEQASFARAVVNGTSPVVSGRDGLEALRIAERINQQLTDQK